MQILVTKMIPYDEAEKLKQSIGGLGGFFMRGMRWKDYCENSFCGGSPHIEAFREYIICNDIKHDGDWHQNGDAGAPLFSDGSAGTFSMRAWGDLMAAVWSEHEDRDYCYVDFAWNYEPKQIEVA